MVKAENKEKKKTCFVIGPIGDSDSPSRIHSDWVLEEIIEPTFKERTDYKVVRADQISIPGMIDAQIISHLLSSEIVIADLSYLNPNVFYEIGIRHVVQKPIIHMQLKDQTPPFDVSIYRALKFSHARPIDIRNARAALNQMLEAALDQDNPVDNPVTNTQGQINFRQQATPSDQVLLDEIQGIKARMESFEHQQRDIQYLGGRLPYSNVIRSATSDAFPGLLSKSWIRDRDIANSTGVWRKRHLAKGTTFHIRFITASINDSDLERLKNSVIDIFPGSVSTWIIDGNEVTMDLSRELSSQEIGSTIRIILENAMVEDVRVS